MQAQRIHHTANGLDIGMLEAHERDQALGVIVRGMRDNPLHIAAFGAPLERRVRREERFFAAAFEAMKMQEHLLAARDDRGRVVGVCGMLPPGQCLPGPAEGLGMLARLLPAGPGTVARSMRWLGAWSKRDPEERHWHLGPVAVDAHLQGQGIGTQMMQVFAARMDATDDAAYLETDKEINVRFYERFGFRVIGEQPILGVTNWFMLRPGRGS